MHPDVECRYGIGDGVKKVMSKLSKSHYQNGFPTGRRAAALASIYESPWQSVDQIQRLACHQATIKVKSKKARFLSLERFAAASCNGLENAKAGLVALAEFLKRSASEHVNQRYFNYTD